ncbi:MAG: alpha/beta hydrolase [Planctomycetota bacterium]
MNFMLIVTGILTGATLVLALLVGALLWLTKRSSRRYWRAVMWGHAGLVVLHLFVTAPAVLGYMGSFRDLGFFRFGTRGDERAYQGPRIDAAGHLLVQDRDSLASEAAAGKAPVGDDVLAAAKARAQFVDSSDGVKVRTFRIEAPGDQPVAVAVLVHGLFRSALELEAVASMLHERGLECWLCEMRNHGGSSRASFTGGLRESDDVVALVEHVRRQPGRAQLPMVLFGVSLGTIAVGYALPRLDGIAGVVLDAPIDDLLATAHRLMQKRLGLWEPWRSLVLTWLGWWSGFAVADVSLIERVATLPHDLPVLVFAEGLDDRATPESVRALFERLPMQEPLKELVEVPEVGHGHAFVAQPALYDAALGRLLQRLRR